MRTMELKNNPVPLWDLSNLVTGGFIRLTRRGKPFAYLLLASHYDEEDIQCMTDPEFWKMIRERRASDDGIPLEEVEARLAKRERAEPATARKPRAARKNGTKKQRN